ncbi:MAG: phosphate ABC transporter substrate-binding protein [Culicoidibacterales bacterium]
MKKIMGILAMAVLSVSLVACGGSTTDSSTPTTVTISGSSSVNALMEELEPAFEAANDMIDLKVSASGSSDGIKAAKEGTSEFGMSSRDLKAEEKSGVNETVIALDGIAVITNSANPVADLSLEQIAQIYKGEITNWSEVGGEDLPIAVVARESASGTRGAFEELLGIEDEMTASATEFNGTGGVKSEVAQNPNAIGYISLGSVDDTIKAVSVDGVEASAEKVQAGEYLIARPFILVYKDAELTDAAKTFLEWTLSEEAQEIVGEGFISVN